MLRLLEQNKSFHISNESASAQPCKQAPSYILISGNKSQSQNGIPWSSATLLKFLKFKTTSNSKLNFKEKLII